MSRLVRLTFFLTCLLALCATSVSAQDNGGVLKVKDEALPNVLRQLEHRFLYVNDDVKGYTFSGNLAFKDITPP